VYDNDTSHFTGGTERRKWNGGKGKPSNDSRKTRGQDSADVTLRGNS